jgi:hypothetical protein
MVEEQRQKWYYAHTGWMENHIITKVVTEYKPNTRERGLGQLRERKMERSIGDVTGSLP